MNHPARVTPQQKYVVAHPERVRETKRLYRERNREKLRASGAEYRARKAAEVRIQKANSRAKVLGCEGELRVGDLPEPGTRCAYCGGTDRVGTDHVVPLSRGGTNTPDNIVPCCLPCNSSKKDKLLSEWSGRQCRKSA